MVVLQKDRVAPRPSSLTRILDVVVSAEANSMTTISMLRPLHNLAIDLSFTRVAAQQLANQMRLRWPSMYQLLYIPHVHDLDGLGLEIVSQLVKGTWTQLRYLRLSLCDLKGEGFLVLSQGNWPCLRELDVSGLVAESMTWLVKGDWPMLSSVFLKFDCSMDANAISHLSAANWPLDELRILGTTFSTAMAAELADLQLPRLRELYLAGSGLTAAAVSELARANWPRLQTLHLMGSGLTAAAVSELARANWPSLHALTVDHDDLDAVAVLFGVDQEKVQQIKSNIDDSSLDDKGDFAVPEQRIDDMVLWPRLIWIKLSKDNLFLGL